MHCPKKLYNNYINLPMVYNMYILGNQTCPCDPFCCKLLFVPANPNLGSRFEGGEIIVLDFHSFTYTVKFRRRSR